MRQRMRLLSPGLGAATAVIARRAGVAAGTLFTYFATKEELLNELYLELKSEAYARINASFPHKGSLKSRARHIWTTYLNWAIEFPEKRRTAAQLNVSDVITAETRMRTEAERGAVDATMSEIERHGASRGLPKGFVAATMSSMHEATIDFIAKQPKKRKDLVEKAFQFYWRAVR